VGKTSIFRRVRGDGFLDDTSKFKHLAEDTIKVRVKDKTVKIHLVDTAGMERYGRLTRQHYYGSHAVLLVYDCDDQLSLETLKGFYKDAKDNAGGAAMVLVRNKIDKELQSVDVREAESLVCNHAKRGKSVCLFTLKAETSAKENSGIKELFEKVATYLIKNAQPSNKRKSEFIKLHEEQRRVNLHEEQRQGTPAPTSTPSGCGC